MDRLLRENAQTGIDEVLRRYREMLADLGFETGAGLDQVSDAIAKASATPLASIKGFGETSVKNLFQAIEDRTENPARPADLRARHPPCRRSRRAGSGASLRKLAGACRGARSRPSRRAGASRRRCRRSGRARRRRRRGAPGADRRGPQGQHRGGGSAGSGAGGLGRSGRHRRHRLGAGAVAVGQPCQPGRTRRHRPSDRASDGAAAREPAPRPRPSPARPWSSPARWKR